MMHLLFLTGVQIFLALVLLVHSSLPVGNHPLILGEEDEATPSAQPTEAPTPTSTPEMTVFPPEASSESTIPATESGGNNNGINSEIGQASQSGSNHQTTSNNDQPGHDQITVSIINPAEITTNPEAINAQSVAEVAKEEEKLTQITDPVVRTQTLLGFSGNKVNDINNFLKSDDQTSVNFASQRLDEQISKISDNLQNLDSKVAEKLRKQTADFCRQADLSLKSAQLMVPEEIEEDLEINRARCLNLTP